MGVMLQAFYWDCPQAENREHEWWSFIKSKLPAISQAGFTALWLPPANKAASWKSMGYDPYDYYDLGEFDQKGGVPTWFGSKVDLLDLIESAHSLGLHVYADLVFNHNSGADAQEVNPLDGQSRWTKFTPKSGKFPRDWTCFHPSQYRDLGRRNLRRYAGSVSPHAFRIHGADQLCALVVGRNRFRRIPLRHGQGLRWLDGALNSGTARAAQRL